jgi:hypothetical protein
MVDLLFKLKRHKLAKNLTGQAEKKSNIILDRAAIRPFIGLFIQPNEFPTFILDTHVLYAATRPLAALVAKKPVLNQGAYIETFNVIDTNRRRDPFSAAHATNLDLLAFGHSSNPPTEIELITSAVQHIFLLMVSI